MSSPESFQKTLSFLRRRWADVIASDLAAGHDFEPELPASAFVHSAGNPPLRTVQASGTAAPQRSARTSISKE
jgi:hypothetical protein